MTASPITLQYELAGDQISGARDYQEDAFLTTVLGESADTAPAQLLVIADGMGGHAAGNVASNLAVQAFNKFVTAHYPTDDHPKLLREAVIAANKGIAEAITSTAALQGMGSTFVAALIEAGKLWWISVGDSHLYLLREHQLHKKNAEHTYGAYLEKMAGLGQEITPDARFSSRLLMSALTGSEIPEIDCPSEPLDLQPGDYIILATDGLDTLTTEGITTHAAAANSAKSLAASLLKAVAEAHVPKQDNTTVLALACGLAAPSASSTEMPAAYQMVMDALREHDAVEAARPARPDDRSQTKSQAKSTRSVWLAAGIGLLALLGAAGFYLWKTASAPVNKGSVSATPNTSTPGSTTTRPTGGAEPSTEPAVEETATLKAMSQVRDKLKSGGVGPEMLMLPAGDFRMGSDGANAGPKHDVTLAQFAVSKYEVTVAEYARFANATGRPAPALSLSNAHPMVMVSWADAEAYAKWVSQQTGKSYRLLSEAEWEYAASAGADTPYWWGEEPGRGKALCQACDPEHPPAQAAKVGQFPANGFGLHDTAGNVSEWIQDCYHPNYEGAPTTGRPWQAMGCTERIYRGGGFRSPSASLRTTHRDHAKPAKRADDLGFRVARDP